MSAVETAYGPPIGRLALGLGCPPKYAAWLRRCPRRVEGYGHGCDGLREAVDGYAQAQDELVEARNRLARAIAGAAMSGMTQDEIVEATGYSPELVQRIVADAGPLRDR